MKYIWEYIISLKIWSDTGNATKQQIYMDRRRIWQIVTHILGMCMPEDRKTSETSATSKMITNTYKYEKKENLLYPIPRVGSGGCARPARSHLIRSHATNMLRLWKSTSTLWVICLRLCRPCKNLRASWTRVHMCIVNVAMFCIRRSSCWALISELMCKLWPPITFIPLFWFAVW